jgi:hypothetical protein
VVGIHPLAGISCAALNAFAILVSIKPPKNVHGLDFQKNFFQKNLKTVFFSTII